MKKKPEEPHINPVPPLKGWALVWKFLQNWKSVLLFLPLSLLAIWGFAEGAYWITGRRPTENVDWIVGTAGNLVKLVFLIIFVETYREQTGIWMTKAEQIANPSLAWSQRLSSSVALCVAAWILSH